jgi:hypothetical protein
MPLVLVLALVVLGMMLFESTYSSASAPVAVQVPIFSNQSVLVSVPASSNITLLSVHGGQYSVGVSQVLRGEELTFSPDSSNGTYSMMVNVSSPSTTSILIMESNGVLQTLVKNVTSSGNMLLNISITVSPQITTGSEWNPLSGFIGLGLKFGGLNLDTTDVMAIFLVLSVSIIGLGIRFSQKMLFFGLALLSLLGIVAVGVLGVGLVLGGYVLSFFAVRSYFGRLGKRNV